MNLNIVMVEPEIPQNTGNVARTCAVTGTRLHLIEPLGFKIEDRYLKRAGLDYWDMLEVKVYKNYDEFFAKNDKANLFFATTKAHHNYCDVKYPDDCWLVFGKETAGLPTELLKANEENCIRIPMVENARSMNLSNSVAVILYEVLRQKNFEGLLCRR